MISSQLIHYQVGDIPSTTDTYELTDAYRCRHVHTYIATILHKHTNTFSQRKTFQNTAHTHIHTRASDELTNMTFIVSFVKG